MKLIDTEDKLTMILAYKQGGLSKVFELINDESEDYMRSNQKNT